MQEAYKLDGCKKVCQDKSGVSDKRPRLDACLGCMRHGDTLVVMRLGRLAKPTACNGDYVNLSRRLDARV